MKRIICAVLAVVMIVSLAGCGGEKPEEVVERVTQAIKEGQDGKTSRRIVRSQYPGELAPGFGERKHQSGNE